MPFKLSKQFETYEIGSTRWRVGRSGGLMRRAQNKSKKYYYVNAADPEARTALRKINQYYNKMTQYENYEEALQFVLSVVVLPILRKTQLQNKLFRIIPSTNRWRVVCVVQKQAKLFARHQHELSSKLSSVGERVEEFAEDWVESCLEDKRYANVDIPEDALDVITSKLEDTFMPTVAVVTKQLGSCEAGRYRSDLEALQNNVGPAYKLQLVHSDRVLMNNSTIRAHLHNINLLASGDSDYIQTQFENQQRQRKKKKKERRRMYKEIRGS
jgi:hypothetical protein